MKPIRLALLTVAALSAYAAQADTVLTTDGARLTGTIVSIADGKIALETSYAGKLEISQDKVASFTTDSPLSVRLASGTIMSGVVTATGEDAVTVASSDGNILADTADVAAAWTPGSRDPIIVASEAALKSQVRKWSYEAGVDISGKVGNSNESAIGLRSQITLEGPKDRLRFYGVYRRTEVEDPDTGVSKVTSDEAIGGLDFTSFFSERWGWFIREELERDTFEGIDFRSTTAGGITHRFLKRETISLEGRLGLSYRYEGYTDATVEDEGLPGMEAGALFYWKFANWGELNTEIVYMPAFEEFGNYRLTHKSTVDLPLGASDFWKLRLGLNNEYVSEAADRENLDTTYFTSLLLKWN